MNRYLFTAAPIVLIASPAIAGEEVIYAAAPDWIAPVDIEAAIAKGEELVLYDRQVRMEDGIVHRYTDTAYKAANSQALTRLGTLQFAWLPDKGDLTIHRLQLIRGNRVIDLVAEGVEANVIRRERELEKRTVDGQLTAVVAVPGMEVGDVLRFSSTTSTQDQALGSEIQAGEGVVANPAKVGFGRVRISWAEDEDIHWDTIGQMDKPTERLIDGYRVVEVMLPIAEPEDMPEDSPARFRLSPAIQVSTFADWSEVANVMAPHFETEGTIAAGGPIAAQIARIKAATSVPLERAALALQLVQDEVSYLMNGLDGGNYLPQSPAQTWELRYGDCKAKSLLLLAMLREMGIEAQAVLVKSEGGDAVTVMQPLPGAFDHMIVRATIDGLDYWLDGTSSGSRLETIHEVPGFKFALPIVAGPTGLLPLEQRWPKVPDRTIRVSYDMSGGVDLPYLFDLEVETRGSMASAMRPAAGETDPFLLIGQASNYLEKLVPGVIFKAAFEFDEQSGIAVLRAKGFDFGAFEFDRNIASHVPDTATTNWAFDPDRARKAWRDIPYQVGGPMTSAQETTYLLPQQGRGVQVAGTFDIDQITAGTRFRRKTEHSGATLRIVDSSSYVPREITVDEIPQEKAAMRRLSSGDLKLRISDPERYWELDNAELARRMSRFEEPMAQMIAVKSDETAFYNLRALIRTMGRDYDGALADLDRAIELEATADSFEMRAQVYSETGDLNAAIDDARRTYALTGSVDHAIYLADLLAQNGEAEAGLAVLDELGLSGEEGHSVAMSWAEVAGSTDRRAEGWEKLTQALADRPGDGGLLNSQCWFIATWQHKLDEGGEVCDRAVRDGNYSAAALDSRALLYHRLGENEKALDDLNAALRKAPSQAASLYLRGFILLQQGDTSGRRDIEHARRLLPSITRTYRRYGIEPAV
ncbi:MAG: DUF3857 domain-containing protein [Qipengyuania sp.]